VKEKCLKTLSEYRVPMCHV